MRPATTTRIPVGLTEHELQMVVGTTGVKDEVRSAGFARTATEAPNPTYHLRETDPNGLKANAPGAKLDAGKVRPALVLGGFARALLEVSKVGTYGATKYTENGWMEVVNGEARYDDAKLRHWLYEKCGIELDSDTDLVHAAHEAWNALARLDLMLRAKEKKA